MMDGAWSKAKLALAGVKDADAHEITGQQVGGALDAGKAAVQAAGKGSTQHGFAHAGDVVYQQMAFAQQCYRYQLNSLAFAENDLFDLIAELLAELLNRCGQT